MANLDEARRRAHMALRAQAHERARATIGGHVGGFFKPARPADFERSIGDTEQAMVDWKAHHPYAMSHDKMPNWVRQQEVRDMEHGGGQNHFGGHTVLPTAPLAHSPVARPGYRPVSSFINPRLGGGGGEPHGFGPGGTVVKQPQPIGGHPFDSLGPPVNGEQPSTGGALHQRHLDLAGNTMPVLPTHPIDDQALRFRSHLLPLGQGLFLHPLTGEIHGFGPSPTPVPPAGAPGGPVGGVISPVAMS